MSTADTRGRQTQQSRRSAPPRSSHWKSSSFTVQEFRRGSLSTSTPATRPHSHKAQCWRRWRGRGLRGRRHSRQSAAFWHNVKVAEPGRCGSVLGGSWSRSEEEQVGPLEEINKSRPESPTEVSNWLFTGRRSRPASGFRYEGDADRPGPETHRIRPDVVDSPQNDHKSS